MNRNKQFFVLGAALVAGGIAALAVGDLVMFKAGDPIKSGEINSNFSAIKGAIQALEVPVNTERLADGAVTLPKLAVSGTTEDGKVLKLAAGKLSWEDDLVGSSGTTYRADGTSLQLSGSTFGVKDAGIGTAKLANGGVTADKLANGAVTASKLSVPLQLIGGADTAVLSVDNTIGNAVAGKATGGTGVAGTSTNGRGVSGTSTSNYGVHGTSTNSDGVFGKSIGAAGVFGESENGSAVVGIGKKGYAAEFSGGKFGPGICYFAGGSGWSCTSDKNAKENFRTINPEEVLNSLAKMPIATWNMKGDKSKTLRLGPTAQDFKKAFGLGNDDKTITTSDAQGVAMAAIQGLYLKNQKLEAQLSGFSAENKALEARLKHLEKRMVGVESVESRRKIQEVFGKR